MQQHSHQNQAVETLRWRNNRLEMIDQRVLPARFEYLVCAVAPVIWLLGLLPIFGLGLDPMSILVPFLIFSIGVSHAVQMTSAWKLETIAGNDGLTASTNCFQKLFIPGAMALLANALGFMVIGFVEIEMVHELALTATIGVSVMIITNRCCCQS